MSAQFVKRTGWFGSTAGVVAAAVMAAAVGLAGSPPAAGDTAPVNPADVRTPVTVSSDALPTAQLNGVAWQQVIVGDTVYVAGRFTTARPAGAAPGTGTVARNNILAYRLSTGVLTSFAPSLNGQALTITASPDGTRIYVGGDFTTVNGISRPRIAAFNTADGSLVSTFNPRPASSVRAVAATNTTVYFGGTFTSVNSVVRSRLAAVRAADGVLLGWNPAANERVNALALSPDGTQVVVGGAFTTLNGSGRPGYGLGRVNSTTGASLAFAANDVVRNAGPDSAVLSLSSDGTNVYGTGYIFGTGGNLEGAFAADWSTGSIRWVEDCHGDTYGIWASPTAVYTAGHAHYCGNLGGFPEVTPRAWHRAIALSRAATGVLTRDPHGYPSFPGVAAPSLLNWFPDLDTGTASGQNQGPWAVSGTADYVAMAGEFRNVNGRPQQGLVRFAVSSIAPDADGPRVGGANTNPSPAYLRPGEVRVRWQTNWDRDNANLTYQVIRDGNAAAPVHTVSRTSTFWNRPTAEFTDTGLSAGSHAYRIFVTDPFGNQVRSDTVTVNVPVGAAPTEPANAAPTAAFSPAVSGMTVSVDGAASTDPDGSVVAYAWDFGDGATGSGAASSRTYAAAGTYTVRLTVTDDAGATGTTARTITVPAAAGEEPASQVLAEDTFGRTLASGLGSAETGGAWTLGGSSSLFSVSGGTGRLTVNRAAGPSAYLAGVSAAGTDSTAQLSLDKVANGGGTYFWLNGRRVGTSGAYQAKVNVLANGAVRLDATRTAGGTETSLASVAVAGLQYAAGQQLQVRLQVTGTSPTTVRAKVWRAGAVEPADWHVSASDSTAVLQAAGGIGIGTYVSGSATNAPVVAAVDNYAVRSVP